MAAKRRGSAPSRLMYDSRVTAISLCHKYCLDHDVLISKLAEGWLLNLAGRRANRATVSLRFSAWAQ